MDTPKTLKTATVVVAVVVAWCVIVFFHRAVFVRTAENLSETARKVSYDSAVASIVDEDYEEALDKLDVYVESPQYVASVKDLPGVDMDYTYARKLDEASARISKTSDKAKKSEIAADMAEIWYSVWNRYYYRNKTAFSALILQAYVKSILLCQVSIDYRDNARAHRQFGITLADLGTSEEWAIREFNEAIRLDPKDGYSLYKLGNAYSYKKDYPKAIEYLKRAMEADPTVEKAHINLANNYGYAGQSAEEMRTLDSNLTICKNTCYVTYRNRGGKRYQLGNLEGALDDFQHAVKDAKDHGVNYKYAYLGIWRVKLKQGKYREAIDNFVLSLNEKDAQERQQDDWGPNLNQWWALVGIAQAYYELKDYKMARSYVLRAKYEKNTEDDVADLTRKLDQAERGTKR